MDELRAVTYHRTDGVRTYGIVAADLAKYFPNAVTRNGSETVLDPSAVSAILLSLVKDLKEENMHLNTQIAHVLYDKGDLEQRLHALEQQLQELRSAPQMVADVNKKRSRRGAAARN